MAYRIMMSLFVAASLTVVGACSAEPGNDESPKTQTEATPRTGSAPGITATGTVTETVDAGRYTYVVVDTGDATIWAAATNFEVAVGDTVVVPLEMPMQDFYSDTLDRTFPLIYFASQIVHPGEAASIAMPPGHPPVTGAAASSHEDSSTVEPVDPADGGVTVARIWAERSKLAGSTATVRGRVVKFNGGIMGTNWVHIQDGTGSAADGTHDLTVTTSADASVGDVVTATGTVATDQDFGAGYTYQVMLKDAELSAD